MCGNNFTTTKALIITSVCLFLDACEIFSVYTETLVRLLSSDFKVKDLIYSWKDIPFWLFFNGWGNLLEPKLSQNLYLIKKMFFMKQAGRTESHCTLIYLTGKYTNILTGCSQTSGVWKEKKCVQVSAFESMRTGSGGAEPMLGGLYKHNGNIQNISKTHIECIPTWQKHYCSFAKWLSHISSSWNNCESISLTWKKVTIIKV